MDVNHRMEPGISTEQDGVRVLLPNGLIMILTSYIGGGDIDLGYVFFPDYVDLCHPNHPDCVTGVTCADCDAGFNPHLVVACNLVTFSENATDIRY